MNLEELNNEYLRLKEEEKNINEEVKEYLEKLDTLTGDVVIIAADEVKARRDGDVEKEEEAKTKHEILKEQILEVKEKLETKEMQAKEISEGIEELKNKLKEDPEMKKYLEEVTQKKFSRRIKVLEEEKKELESKKTKLEEIKQLVTDHKILGNNLRGMLVANNTINKNKKELEKLEINVDGNIIYKDPARAQELKAEISDSEGKQNTNRRLLQTYIEGTKNKYNINMQDIDEFISNDKYYVIKDNNEINLDETIGKNITQINRQIKGKDKQIRNYEISLNKYKTQTEYKKLELEKEEIVIPKASTEPVVELKEEIEPNIEQEEEIEEKNRPETTTKKVGWFRRFLNWITGKKQPALQEANAKSISEPTIKEPTETKKEESEEDITLDETLIEKSNINDDIDQETVTTDDEYLNEAIKFAFESDKVTPVSIQKKLGVGYKTATKMVDQMKDKGIISDDGNVLITEEDWKKREDSTEKIELDETIVETNQGQAFRNALKYDLVRDMREELEKETLKDAKQENKQKNNDVNER